jgi:CheY-like chemotaxis protein
MGGRIWLESQVGKGSKFHFTARMGIGAVPAPEALQRESEPHSPGRPLMVLVAEDNPVNRQVAAHLLRKHGHQVVLVENGRAAVEEFYREEFDVVLMDVQMPGMDGYQATAAIRERERNIGSSRTPIVALTAHAMKGDREHCLAAGMDEYLPKPIDPTELQAVLARVSGHLPRETNAPPSVARK